MKNHVTGLILAGGRGTRMGRVDKGLQPFRGATLAFHVLGRLAPQVGTVLINANRNLPQYQALLGPDGAAVLADDLGGYEGPLAGLRTGLRHCPTPLLLTVPCDSPFLPAHLAERLYAALLEHDADLAVAATMEAEETDGGPPQLQPRLHPVFALLKAELLPRLDAYLATGARRMEGWYKSLRMTEVLFDDADAFRNINTLQELQRHELQPHEREPAPVRAETDAASDAISGAIMGVMRGPAAGTAADAASGPTSDVIADATSAATSAAEAPAAGDDSDALPVARALRLIAERVTAVGAVETLPLTAALGRVLAHDITSPINVPAYDNSAMDGYALRGADLPAAGAVTLPVAGVAYAGRAYAGHVAGAGTEVAPGQCVRIMTGAAIPAGCDTIVPQELAAAIGADSVTIAAGAVAPGANRRHAGEDLRAGGVALAAGKVLRPADLGLVASLGVAEVAVRRRLRVAFFSTGDELRSLGEPLEDGCVYDSNRYTLHGMLARLGCETVDLGIVRDDPAALEAALRHACGQADAIITSGGVSVGAADYTREILARLGDVAFWKLAMRPGRPLAFGRVASGDDGAWLFGLPGNPVAVMVSFYLFARPALLRMMGAAEGQCAPPLLRARSLAAIRKRPGRAEYQRGILSHVGGEPVVRLTGAQGSGILSSMSAANCIVVLHDGQGGVAAGDMVDVLPFDGLI